MRATAAFREKIMRDQLALDEYLEAWAGSDDLRRAAASTIKALSGACREIAAMRVLDHQALHAPRRRALYE
jgi:hypothetical protein